MSFFKTENFKARVATSVVLLVVSLIAFFTPDIVAFRVLFAAAGIMAMIEIGTVARQMTISGNLPNDTAVTMEILAIAIGSLVVAMALSPKEIFMVLVAGISSDTFAYIAGSVFNGMVFNKRPFPKTSPKKTWEGIIGGYIGSMIATFAFLVLYKYYHDGLTNLERMPFQYLEIAFVLFAPLFAIFGDWLESFAKRCLGLKDSNEGVKDIKFPLIPLFERLMEGHGGFADRIDSWVLVACFLAWLKIIFT